MSRQLLQSVKSPFLGIDMIEAVVFQSLGK